jgi:hypothetical protein
MAMANWGKGSSLVKNVDYDKLVPFDFKGLLIREMPPEGLKSGSVAEIEVLSGVAHPLVISSKSDKLYICTEGQATFQINDKDVILNPKDLL